MENATKALLMAGGVLIAVIIIALLVRTYGNIGAFQRQQLSAEEAEQIEEFNKDYTKYDGQYVYGTEVITVINRATNEGKKSGSEIKVYITFGEEGYTYNKKGKKINIGKNGTLILNNGDDVGSYISTTNGSIFIDEESNKEALEDLKQRAFKCTKIGYNNSTGKVNEIRFAEKQYNN